MPVKIGKAICEIIISASMIAALLFVTAVSHGDMGLKEGAWRIGVSIAVMCAAAWKRGWLR